MYILGIIKRFAPFFLTFVLGLFIASFFVTISAPQFNFKARSGRKHHHNNFLRSENQRLQQRNDYLERRNAELERMNNKFTPNFESLEVPPPPMPPMPPKAPIAPNYTR